MTKRMIAIDVVLLPSHDISDMVIKLSQRIAKGKNSELVLSDSSLPHISLCMGCIVENDIKTVEEKLKDILDKSKIELLEITGITSNTFFESGKTTGINIRRTRELSMLQQEIMNSLWPLLSYDPKPEMFVGSVNENTLQWVRRYAEKYKNPAKFEPHISLGLDKSDDEVVNTKFSPRSLAVFWLSNFCTCKKMMFEIKI